jgi:NAD(P)-dependent dehydrogenase (short-subunit alcohol dehydrogenase family)
MSSEFAGKVVLITGAAGNLGRAVAHAFGQAGALLALLDRDPARLEGIYGSPNGRFYAGADLMNADAVTRAVHDAARRFGRVDVVANIAGGFSMGPPIHETPIESWELMMNLNARSAFYVCRAAIPHLLQAGGGAIVNVSARAAREGKARMGPYCASKAAVITLTETLAAEHRHAGIRVNCILPGTIDTPENRRDMPGADFSKWVAPAALADVVLFLASSGARAISGASVPVYGES